MTCARNIFILFCIKHKKLNKIKSHFFVSFHAPKISLSATKKIEMIHWVKINFLYLHEFLCPNCTLIIFFESFWIDSFSFFNKHCVYESDCVISNTFENIFGKFDIFIIVGLFREFWSLRIKISNFQKNNSLNNTTLA